MKKIILLALVVFITFGTAIENLYKSATITHGISLPPENTNYSIKAQVVDYDEDSTLTICEDNMGNLWSFYFIGELQEGDNVQLVMDTQGTEIRCDDAVIDAVLL